MKIILSVIILLLIIYGVFHKRTVYKSTEDSVSINNIQNHEQFTGNILERTASQILSNIIKTEDGRKFIEHMIQPMQMNNHSKYNNVVDAMFNVKDTGGGNIGPAYCGDLVQIHYAIYDDSNNVILERSASHILGYGNIIDSTVVGMMIHQTRHAKIPSMYFNSDVDNKKLPHLVSVVVTLDSLHKNAPYYDKIRTYTNNTGYRLPLMCGDVVRFQVKCTNFTSNTFVEKQMEIKLGDVEYPLLSYILYSAIPSGTYSAIVNGSDLYSKKHDVFNVKDDNKYYLLEITDLDVIHRIYDK